MSTLFINASPNKDGNTVRLAKRLLAGTPHKALDLVDCLLLPYGQHREGDQFEEVARAIQSTDDILAVLEASRGLVKAVT